MNTFDFLPIENVILNWPQRKKKTYPEQKQTREWKKNREQERER